MSDVAKVAFDASRKAAEFTERVLEMLVAAGFEPAVFVHRAGDAGGTIDAPRLIHDAKGKPLAKLWVEWGEAKVSWHATFEPDVAARLPKGPVR